MKRSISAEMLLAMLSGGCGDPETKRLAVGARAFLVDRDKFNGTAQSKIDLWGGERLGVNALVSGRTSWSWMTRPTASTIGGLAR
jgi:hypothetical protein